MASTTNSSSKKRARVEKSDAKYRKGVTFRVKGGVPLGWVVEMRFPKKIASGLKMYLGMYDSKEEAMIARDYVAFLRSSTGKEEFPAVGGYYDYNQRDDPTAIFEFVESPEIFDKLDPFKVRCDEFKCLLALYLQDGLNSVDARDTFVENARGDILLAIKSFRSTYPEKFGTGSDGPDLLMTDPVDGEAQVTTSSLTCGIRVLPNVGDGRIVSRVKVVITLEDFARETQNLSNEELCSVVRDNFDHDKIRQAVTNKSHQKQLPDEMLATLPPCTIDPTDYPPP